MSRTSTVHEASDDTIHPGEYASCRECFLTRNKIDSSQVFQDVLTLLQMTKAAQITPEQFVVACEISYGLRQRNEALAHLINEVHEGRLPIAALVAATSA